jgi:putative ABC transport system permease protein
MSSVTRDIGFAARTLIKSPVFALTALATIALGIGATTAIFSIVNTVLLRPLPYRNADRLAFVTSDLTARNVTDFWIPPGDMPDLRREITALDEVAMVGTFQIPLVDERGDAQMLRVGNVTTNLFRTLGVRVALGRDFVDADGAPIAPPPAPPAGAQAPGGGQPQQAPPPATTILSHEFWQRNFGGDPKVIGRTMQFGNLTAEIVGVLEPGTQLFWFPGSNIESHPDIYWASRINFATASRMNANGRMIGRLRAGATFATAQAQANAVVSDLRKRFPIKETAGVRWRVEPMHQYLVANSKQTILTLMGAVVFVLLIACANVANLLLVRTSQRSRELAVRAALGGSRTVLLRQMLIESLVIAGGGALLGIMLAWFGIGVLTSIGPQNLPRLGEISLDPIVLTFTIVAAALSALVFGIVPAVRASRVDVADILRAGGRSPALSGAGKWLRTAVVTAAVSLAFVLLVGSGLMIRSFAALMQAAPGFDPAGVLTFTVANVNEPTPEARSAAQRRIDEALTAIPGVTGVTATSNVPLDGTVGSARWGPEAARTNPALFQQADTRLVMPDYFSVLRTPLLDGRAFTAADDIPNQNRIIIDDVLAAKAFPNESAVGKRILARVSGDEATPWEIIGVVKHQRTASLAADGRETIYMPAAQFGFGVNRVVVRTNGDPTLLAPAIRAALREVNPRYLMHTVQPLDELVDVARGPTRFALVCIGVFAVVAVVLALVGLYGVLATVVRQRTAEIGVRMAFGAQPSGIFRLVVGQGMRLAALGIGIGLFAAFALTRVMRSMLVGVSATDPVTFVGITALFVAVAALACWLPARRAARLDPLVALREE